MNSTLLERHYFRIKRLTSRFRHRPAFLIIGAQKGGTTSLYNYLLQHPQVKPAWVKEIHYFDIHHQKPLSWYRAHFPLSLPDRFGSRNTGPRYTGEATPYYLFHPLAPRRAAVAVPEARLICLLRNPIDRAFSHYNHNRRKGREKRTFTRAVRDELRWMPSEAERVLRSPFVTRSGTATSRIFPGASTWTRSCAGISTLKKRPCS